MRTHSCNDNSQLSQEISQGSSLESQDSSLFKKKHKGPNWTKEETRSFIKLCIEKRIVQMLDRKCYKHITDIYSSLEPRMKEMGFVKSAVQMKTKFKHLKEMYFKCKRNNNISGARRQTFSFYDEMEQLFIRRPSVQTIADISIDSSGSSSISFNSFKKKHKGSNWTKEETRSFIKLCIEKRIVQMMDGKRYKHIIDIYSSLEPRMKEMGFVKSAVQMKTKFKHLKEMYFKYKRNNNISGANHQMFSFYDEMEQLFIRRPSVQAIADIGLTQKEAFEVEDNIEASLEDETENNISVQNNTLPSKKKIKTTGRSTHMKLAENFAEVFAKTQAEEMQKVMKEQMRIFDDAICAQMENQQQWEKEMMEKEHQHQNLILQNFLKGLREMQTSNFQYSQFVPTSIPMFPSTSAAQNLYPYDSYELSSSPSLSPSPTPSSSLPVNSSHSPSSSPTSKNFPE